MTAALIAPDTEAPDTETVTAMLSEPARALQRCLDPLLGEIQTCFLAPPLTGSDDRLAKLFDHLAAASRFLTGPSVSESAGLCQTLHEYWRETPAQVDPGRHRRRLSDLLRCRDSLREITAQDALRQVMAAHVGTIIDGLTRLDGQLDGAEGSDAVQEACTRCSAILGAARFLESGMSDHLQLPPPDPRALLRWLLMLEQQLTSVSSPVSAHQVFRRELQRCLRRCGRSPASDGLSQTLWQLQLLAGAGLALAVPTGHDKTELLPRRRFRQLLATSAQALYQRRCAEQAEPEALREVLRQALSLLAAHESGEFAPAAPGLVLTSLPGPARAPMQALLTVIPAHDQAPDWATISLHLYRLLVCLRMLAGGFVDIPARASSPQELVPWLVLVASLYASTQHCVQQSVVTAEDQNRLLELLRRLPRRLMPESVPEDKDLVPAAVLLAARLGLRAQRHWQRLTLTLDAVQQDFVDVSVQRVLAAQLHYLPRMGAGSGDGGHRALPQDVLCDLRLLLKGARILNVPRIESLVLVMIEIYQLILDEPAFGRAPDIAKVLPRAHRSLSRMLDQAAAWQAPGNARRVINSLYGCLERWRGDGNTATACGVFASVSERPAGQRDDSWQMCLTTNRRLRKLLRHQEDLEMIRALLLELLRSQEELIRRQTDYAATPDAPPV